ncbi:U7 snRNA-associated Sm-like protein LSm11 [Pungitius pungitius]|uniref:U7 snRNA-associated Sm-like protein LSm11 n=1 Tax=Pungitius pungitius TaxID=134920 RepID=UPI002E15FA06
MEERERKSAKSDTKASVSTTPPLPERDAGDDDAKRTDVCSDRFDPLAALYSPAVPLPFPNIKGFNNVAAYESFMKGGRGRAKPENVEKRRRKAMKGVADPERIARLKKLIVNNPVTEAGESSGGGGGGARSRRRTKPQKNVLTRMPLCKGSPMGELYRCVEERIRVKVHIRTFKGLRGVCSGFVVAFDKFWNMAMVDVDETYREPLLGEAFHHEKALTISRLFEKLKLQENPGGGEPEEPARGRRPLPAKEQQQPPQRGGAGTQPEEPDAAGTKRGQGQAAPKAPTRGSPKYGKVHTRHINQLFIRGENVLLVNPQPL